MLNFVKYVSRVVLEVRFRLFTSVGDILSIHVINIQFYVHSFHTNFFLSKCEPITHTEIYSSNAILTKCIINGSITRSFEIPLFSKTKNERQISLKRHSNFTVTYGCIYIASSNEYCKSYALKTNEKLRIYEFISNADHTFV